MASAQIPAEHSEPRFVAAILDWRPAWFIARLLLVGAYLQGGFTKLFDWPSAVAEQAHFGLAMPAFWAALTIAVEIAGALMIIFNRLAWLGAGMLGVFTVLAACIANDFWNMHGQARFMAANAFFEHLGLAGAFVLAAMLARRRGTA